MTQTYRKKTIEEIENEFEKLLAENTAYAISKNSDVSQAMLSRLKSGERAITLEKKVEILEKFFGVEE